MYPPIIRLICALMSRGCPWSVSAVIVRPGRSTSERFGTCGEWIRRKIGSCDTPFCAPARADVCDSIAARICASCGAVGSGHCSEIVSVGAQTPDVKPPNSARIADGSGVWTSCSESGARVHICSPSGRMSAAMIPLSSDDLPLDCVPTTTSRGTSGCLILPCAAGVPRMPSSALAMRSTSEPPPIGRSVPPSSGDAVAARASPSAAAPPTVTAPPTR